MQKKEEKNRKKKGTKVLPSISFFFCSHATSEQFEDYFPENERFNSEQKKKT